MKKIYSADGIKTINMIAVSIEFSREIAYWGESYYYENPKFWEWWDTKFNDYCNKSFNVRVWNTAFCNRHCAELAEEGNLEHNIIRYLHNMRNANIVIGPTMNTILFHSPSEFPTTHSLDLSQLAQICHACAKYCGGTVKITYSKRQHYFAWDDTAQNEIELGTGHSDLIKSKEPKRTKTAREVNHSWESNPKDKKTK